MLFISKKSSNKPRVLVGTFVAILLLGTQACSVKPVILAEPMESTGKWILEADGSTMLDPQTSGLSFYNGLLYSVSDGSAHASQIKKLHQIDPSTGAIVGRLGPLALAPSMQDSCFIPYLDSSPDYEALVAVPGATNTWLLVTEDATRAGNYSDACKQKFADTGSTEHPSLLVRVELVNEVLVVTGIRALQFSAADGVGNFPNDGLEGMTITRDGRILLGLEKDALTKARIFEVALTEHTFTQLDTFLPVVDAGLDLPDMGEGNHPINGMDIYYPSNNDAGLLIVAARNQDQLWIMDLGKKRPTQIIDMVFYSPCEGAPNTAYKIANTALEGLAVDNNTLYLINDPWKKVYRANAREDICAADTLKYERMSPLLFEIALPACFADATCEVKG